MMLHRCTELARIERRISVGNANNPRNLQTIYMLPPTEPSTMQAIMPLVDFNLSCLKKIIYIGCISYFSLSMGHLSTKSPDTLPFSFFRQIFLERTPLFRLPVSYCKYLVLLASIFAYCLQRFLSLAEITESTMIPCISILLFPYNDHLQRVRCFVRRR